MQINGSTDSILRRREMHRVVGFPAMI